MPHDKHGRLIEKGDTIAAPHIWPYGDELSPAQVVHIEPKQETCNLAVRTFTQPGLVSTTASQAEILLKHDGSKPIPEVPAAAQAGGQ